MQTCPLDDDDLLLLAHEEQLAGGGRHAGATIPYGAQVAPGLFLS